MIERTTVRLPTELLKKARRKAAEENRTLTSLVEDGLRYIVEERPKQKPGKRKLPRVSTATGGFYPGINISNNAAIQELEDLEYIQRLKRGFR